MSKHLNLIKDGHFKPYHSEALGCYVKSMKHRKQIMESRGLSEYDSSVKRSQPNYKPSKELHQMANALMARADKDGNVQMGSVLIDKLKSQGVVFDRRRIEEAQGKKGWG